MCCMGTILAEIWGGEGGVWPTHVSGLQIVVTGGRGDARVALFLRGLQILQELPTDNDR